MVVDRRETREAGQGDVVMRYKTVERGGPTDRNFVGATHRNSGPAYSLFGKMAIRVREGYYGFSRHEGTLYRTYNHNTLDNIGQPMPGIKIWGSGPGSMDRRGAVLMHWASQHYPIIGCVGVYKGNERENTLDEARATEARRSGWQIGQMVDYRYIGVDHRESFATMLEIFALLEQFLGSRIPSGRCRNVAFEIIESY